ncbi:hypothetical protein PABY_05750 [Pyrodictium abyssi]|uniref:Uncharacterized protein n=1 Tax=Pyrodictium abyssi TaxID=54256 RepID=A0ABN6ZRK9_9CREN|nr:hypothetical protein PABY_05750 [Pyrodictium abyssi]
MTLMKPNISDGKIKSWSQITTLYNYTAEAVKAFKAIEGYWNPKYYFIVRDDLNIDVYDIT